MTPQKSSKPSGIKKTRAPSSASPSSPSKSKSKAPASTKDFTEKHWIKLNVAATRFLERHAGDICALDNDLAPWMPKGGIINLLRQLTKSAKQGLAAAKLMAEENKKVKSSTDGVTKPSAAVVDSDSD